jgi:hypothetical protein
MVPRPRPLLSSYLIWLFDLDRILSKFRDMQYIFKPELASYLDDHLANPTWKWLQHPETAMTLVG